MALELARVVAIVTDAGQQGSGVLLNRDLVLTAAHVLDGARSMSAVRAAVPGGLGWKPCRTGEIRGHLAVLTTEEPLLRRPVHGLSATAWNGTLNPLYECYATGYPDIERDDAENLGAFQVTGTLSPGPGADQDLAVLHTDFLPPLRTRGDTPWAGLSGAGVFRGDTLIGIVLADHAPARWRHTRLEVVGLRPFFQQMPHHARLFRVPNDFPPQTEAERFEHNYRDSLRAQHGRLQLFGIDLDDRVRADVDRMELDTAYLSLSARPELGEPDAMERSGRIETMLADRRLTLLRGTAGSGKTTLVQWLAMHAQKIPGFEDQVPFVLKLRSLDGLPHAAEFLSAARSPLAGTEPRDWVDSVLRTGRGLLLIDGVDEIPEQDRPAAREWLSLLLRLYPGTAALVTARPSAVPKDWLAADGFGELHLEPMNGDDRTAFIHRWHQAAGPDQAKLSELRDALVRTLETSPTLASLTDSPLLCAMICALHRNRSGSLPQGRMEVYRAALSMLLARRDDERKVRSHLELSESDHLALLQALAHWLALEGKVEGLREDALHQIRRTQRSFGPQELRELDAEKIYRHLLTRSGLLREPSEGTFEFIHRTFQDYLAAKEFEETRAFNLLLKHADDEQWADIIRMTVGHASPGDRACILAGLLAADTQTADSTLLAGSCLPYADRLDPELRARVLEVLPALTANNVVELSLVGDDLLAGLHLTQDSYLQPLLLGLIGSPLALEALAHLAHLGNDQVPSVWDLFDAKHFAERVLASLDPDKLNLTVVNEAQFRELTRLGRPSSINFIGLPASLLASNPAALDVRHLRIRCRDLENLELLSALEVIQRLALFKCPRLRDPSQLPRRVHHLLLDSELVEAWAARFTLPWVKQVQVLGAITAETLTQVPALFGGLSSLAVEAPDAGLDLAPAAESLLAVEGLRIHVMRSKGAPVHVPKALKGIVTVTG